jgi:hypothetical protein
VSERFFLFFSFHAVLDVALIIDSWHDSGVGVYAMLTEESATRGGNY